MVLVGQESMPHQLHVRMVLMTRYRPTCRFPALTRDVAAR